MLKEERAPEKVLIFNFPKFAQINGFFPSFIKIMPATRGGFRGGGGAGRGRTPPLGFDPLPTQRVPLILF